VCLRAGKKKKEGRVIPKKESLGKGTGYHIAHERGKKWEWHIRKSRLQKKRKKGGAKLCQKEKDKENGEGKNLPRRGLPFSLRKFPHSMSPNEGGNVRSHPQQKGEEAPLKKRSTCCASLVHEITKSFQSDSRRHEFVRKKGTTDLEEKRSSPLE